ncbi:hypothetical protein M405DRAFT_932167 [Rhizopogon salebrosus TDB-379]|nr:hypothetical protein M405DRAFT_932167 [Rhizopogon salebrosus TDB-379]
MSLPVQFAQDIWVRKAFSAAGHTLLVYDYFLTLGDEVSYIWNAPWKVVKVLFLINRYGNLLGQTFIRLEEAGLLTNNSQSFCTTFGSITTYFMILSMELTHSAGMLVLMRAWAIWGTQKRIMKIFIAGYMASFIVLLVGATYGFKVAHVHYQYLDLAKVCVVGIPNYAWAPYFGSFILDSILFVLTMRSLRKYSREFQYLYPSGLIYVLVRDAIIFFSVSIFSNVLIIASWTIYSDNAKYFLAKGFAIPVLSVAGQRLVLNLRSLKTRTYETHDLSREVDRQLEAFGEADSSIVLDDIGDPEIGR